MNNKHVFLVVLALLASGALHGQDIPLQNWTVPPYTHSSSGGLTTMTDVTSPRAFIGIQPCRVADTRGNGAPITGGIFANSEARNWTVWGVCGIPNLADAISVNFTVTASPGSIPPGSFLLAWPTGQPPPPTAIMTYGPGQTISNAAIVPLSAAGQLTVNVSGSTHIVMDVNGYFSDALQTPANVFRLVNDSSAETMYLENQSSTCSGGCGLVAVVDSDAIANAVSGSYAGTGAGSGVFGDCQGDSFCSGVRGTSTDGEGVRGTSVDGNGVLGESTNTFGIIGFTGAAGPGQAGVLGQATGDAGIIYGGRFATDSSSNDAAGVLGTANIDGNPVATPVHGIAGVRGESSVFGVLGLGETGGVRGVLMDAVGMTLAAGTIGSSQGADPPGVAPWAFFGFLGDIGGIGVKSFVEPHPTDASKIIQYISLEGPEAGTYFRGRGKFEGGLARISVPEDFRMVTDPEGLTVQITPIGAMATVGVLGIGLDEIVVQSSRNVEFSYLVQGVRAAYRDRTPIRPSGLFAPESSEARLPERMNEVHKQRLIQNGTYNVDGTPNTETARRFGWDRVWAEKRKPPPRATAVEEP